MTRVYLASVSRPLRSSRQRKVVGHPDPWNRDDRKILDRSLRGNSSRGTLAFRLCSDGPRPSSRFFRAQSHGLSRVMPFDPLAAYPLPSYSVLGRSFPIGFRAGYLVAERSSGASRRGGGGIEKHYRPCFSRRWRCSARPLQGGTDRPQIPSGACAWVGESERSDSPRRAQPGESNRSLHPTSRAGAVIAAL